MTNRRSKAQKMAEEDLPAIEGELIPAEENTNAELIAKINQLKAALEKAQQKEKTLLQTLDQLQAQLDEQKTIVQRLETAVKQANQVHQELKQAQKTALRLAESNQKLIEENNALLHEKHEKTVAASTKPLAELALANEPAQTDGDLRRHQEILRQRQAARLSHPVFPNNPEPTQFEDRDIGWVD
jgi:translation initiation factor 2B subunit (eIF-2B alpha/beta/delta family)